MRRLFHVIACICLVASVPISFGADKIEFHGLDDFRPLVLTNETLALSGVDVVTLTNGKAYLLSLGTAMNQAKHDSNARAKLDTRKVAEAKARKTAAEFINVEISTEDKLTQLRTSERISTNEGLKSQVSKIIKVREEIITQKSQVAFAGSKTVATWLSDNGNSFSAVIAFEIANKESK